MFLINAIKHNVDKIFKTFFCISLCDCLAYKIKPVLFLIVLCFLAETKTLFKINGEMNYYPLVAEGGATSSDGVGASSGARSRLKSKEGSMDSTDSGVSSLR